VLTNETCIVPDFSCAPWSDAILITPCNSVQTHWNARAIEKHSMLSGEIMYICPAEDSTGGTPLSPSQRLTIAAVPLKDTEQLPTMIRIVKGMRVMVTRNISTAANLSNGSRGRIADIILDPREDPIGQSAIQQRRSYLHYPPILVIIELDFCELPQLPGLPPRYVPLSPISSKIHGWIKSFDKSYTTTARTYTCLRFHGLQVTRSNDRPCVSRHRKNYLFRSLSV